MICRRPWPTVLLVVAVGAIALLTVSCGDSNTPYTPPITGVTPAPPPPEPPPSSGGAGGSSCSLGEGDDNAVCERSHSEMMTYVEGAIDWVVETYPAFFDTTVEKGDWTSQFRVLDKEGYIDGVLDRLRVMGFCAQRSDYDYEIIQLKQDNDLSEDFDIYLSDGFIRRSGSYRQSCSPAAFPVTRPDWAPPQGSGCGKPYPPEIYKFKVKIHFKNSEYWTLDSTPLVGPNAIFCAAIGYTDSRSLCPMRPEGHPEKEACEAWGVGKARDTGRVGPTWDLNGEYCTGPSSGCQNADNQFFLWAYSSGAYSACAANMACGHLTVDRDN